MIYFVSHWEQSPGSYTLEVMDELWNNYERVPNVPANEVKRVEMELMCKWKDRMAENGFSPDYFCEMEMEG